MDNTGQSLPDSKDNSIHLQNASGEANKPSGAGAVVRGVGALARPAGPGVPTPFIPQPAPARPPPRLLPLARGPRPTIDQIVQIESALQPIQANPLLRTERKPPVSPPPLSNAIARPPAPSIQIHSSQSLTNPVNNDSIQPNVFNAKRVIRNVPEPNAFNEEDEENSNQPTEKKVRRLLDPSIRAALQNRNNVRVQRVSRAPPARQERPEPPAPRAPGIPDGQPPPPEEKPVEVKITPGPLLTNTDDESHKTAQTKWVAAQKSERKFEIDQKAISFRQSPTPDDKLTDDLKPAPYKRPEPPTTVAPTTKGKKILQKEEVVVRRRDRANPEFELSSSDEEDKDDFEKRAVKQPKPPTHDIDRLEAMTKQHLAQYSALLNPDTDKSIPVTDRLRVSVKKPFQDIAPLVVEDMNAEPSNISPVIAHSQSFIQSFKLAVDKSSKKSPTILESKSEGSIKPKYSQKEEPKQIQPEVSLDEENNFTLDMVNDHRLAGLIPRGRLSITCLEAQNLVFSKQSAFSAKNLSVKLRLGPSASLITGSKNDWKTTSISTSVPSEIVPFDNEILFFDMIDARQYIAANDLSMTIKIIQHHSEFFPNNKIRIDEGNASEEMREETIAIVTMSVLRFFRQPYIRFVELIPLRTKLDNSSSKIRLEFLFEEARAGMFVFKLYEASNLRYVTKPQDPYVLIEVGPNYSKRSSIAVNGGDSPYFQEEEIIMWADEVNWSYNLSLAILDRNIGLDDPIATTNFSLLPYMNSRPEDAKRGIYDLTYIDHSEESGNIVTRELSQGELSMKVTFLPSGKLTVLVGRGTGLQFPSDYNQLVSGSGSNERLDAFVELQLEGQAVNLIKRTPVDKDGGIDPVWDYEIELDVVDQTTLVILVFHQPSIGGDVLIGRSEYPLFQLFRNGRLSSWLPLKQRRTNGSMVEAGNIYLDLKFNALPGIAFPQYRKDVPTFDDTVRAILPSKAEQKEDDLADDIVGKVIDTIPHEEDITESTAAKEDSSATAVNIVEDNVKPEFTDEEIRQAFNFIDLNHNGFIGASEIRHILICMGELITDEEIDVMISMVDLDGDGQVSFQEFRALVLHPNPHSVDMHKEIQKQVEKDALQDKLSLGGKTTNLDLKSFQRQKELRQREQKKLALIRLIEENDFQFQSIGKIFEHYQNLPPDRLINNRVDFPTFCQLLKIDPIYEYNQLHKLFDEEESNTVDFKEFLLSLMNFIGNISIDTKVAFIFNMFDTKLTGHITSKEISEILRGNHIVSMASIEKKCETIMRQTPNGSNGLVSLSDFILISKKFPNILFPSLGRSSNTLHTSNKGH